MRSPVVPALCALLMVLMMGGGTATAQSNDQSCPPAGDSDDGDDVNVDDERDDDGPEMYPALPGPDVDDDGVCFETENSDVVIVPGDNWSDTVIVASPDQDDGGEGGVRPGQVLGTAQAAPDGQVRIRFEIPADAPAGPFPIVLQGRDRAGQPATVLTTIDVPVSERHPLPQGAPPAALVGAEPLSGTPASAFSPAPQRWHVLVILAAVLLLGVVALGRVRSRTRRI